MAAAVVSSCTTPAAVAAPGGKIVAVGAENQYANVISQIGGKYVSVSAVMSNPNTDPHTFESSPRVAQAVSRAGLVVQNGLGYDSFMGRIERASPDPERKVIDVQTLLSKPDSTPNPHLWYSPSTMPVVARAIGDDLAAMDPSHRAYFEANVTSFVASLGPWRQALAALKASYRGAPVATTEPVADYMLAAAGLSDRTPLAFQTAIMNGIDPSPQAVALVDALFAGHKVKALVYNQQVTDAITKSLVKLAASNHIPVVGVYETMPTPGYDYQTWMVAEVQALDHALATGRSAPRL